MLPLVSQRQCALKHRKLAIKKYPHLLEVAIRVQTMIFLCMTSSSDDVDELAMDDVICEEKPPAPEQGRYVIVWVGSDKSIKNYIALILDGPGCDDDYEVHFLTLTKTPQ